MTTILNLTQHQATAEQIAQGVIDLPADQKAKLASLLTFDDLPTKAEVEDAASSIAKLAAWASTDTPVAAMIGGAPFLMPALERALEEVGIKALYAFSRRESVDQQQPDGSVRKVAVFRHIGFVEA